MFTSKKQEVDRSNNSYQDRVTEQTFLSLVDEISFHTNIPGKKDGCSLIALDPLQDMKESALAQETENTECLFHKTPALFHLNSK